MALTRLDGRDGAALIGRVVGDKALPAEVAAQIVSKADGVALFVEELTKAVLESGMLKDMGETYELAGPLPPHAIPTTLHDSLMARLDRLAPVKEVARKSAPSSAASSAMSSSPRFHRLVTTNFRMRFPNWSSRS